MQNRIGYLDYVALELYGKVYKDLEDWQCSEVARIVEKEIYNDNG